MSSDVVSPPEKSMVPTNDERTWGLLAHLSGFLAVWAGGLGFVGPLIVWLVKKDQSQFVGAQAREALNFQLTVLLAMVVCIVTIIGWLLIPVVIVGAILFPIMATMEANKGINYRYPYTIRFIND